MDYQSYATVESKTFPGVQFRVRRLSLARRMELIRRIREASEKLAFHQAGDQVKDAADAAEIQSGMDVLYVRWGLDEITGMTIDGQPVTVDNLLERGPDSLAREVVEAVKAELFLNEDERKN